MENFKSSAGEFFASIAQYAFVNTGDFILIAAATALVFGTFIVLLGLLLFDRVEQPPPEDPGRG